MNSFTKAFVWLGGYIPSTVTGDHPEDVEPITKVGGAILFATIFSSVNWGISGFTYAEGNGLSIRLAAAAAAASLGVFVCLVFDRSFVYFADTAATVERTTLAMYGLFRAIVIVAVGSITAQAVMPLILGSEMRAHGLHMAEQSERSRASDLNAQFRVEEKQGLVTSAKEEVARFEKAVVTLPPVIQLRLSAAKACWATYGAQKASLMESGSSHDEARAQLAWKADNCSRDEKAAKTERDGYFSRARDQLEHATTAKQQSEAELSQVNATVKARIERGHQVESESYNPHSSTVLWSLVMSDTGALMKWALVSFLILVCELLPLLQKWQAGQSNIGRRIAVNGEIRRIELLEQLTQLQHDVAVSSAVNATSKKAVEQALNSPEVLATFKQAFAANIAAYAPTEAVRAMMRDFRARHVDVDEFMHRYPRYAAVISQAWSKAIKDTSAILSRGFQAGAGSGVGTTP